MNSASLWQKYRTDCSSSSRKEEPEWARLIKAYSPRQDAAARPRSLASIFLRGREPRE